MGSRFTNISHVFSTNNTKDILDGISDYRAEDQRNYARFNNAVLDLGRSHPPAIDPNKDRSQDKLEAIAEELSRIEFADKEMAKRLEKLEKQVKMMMEI